MTVIRTSAPNEQETEMLSRYLEEDLDIQEREQVEAMLKERPEVREELESLRQTLSLMSRLPSIEAPPDFVQKVKRKVRRQRRIRVDQQHQFRMPYEALGVILVILMVVLYILVQQHSRKKTSPTKRCAAVQRQVPTPERARAVPVKDKSTPTKNKATPKRATTLPREATPPTR